MKGQCQMKNTERNLLDILYANIIDYLNGVPCANMEPLEEEIRERLYNFICKRFSVSTLEEIPNERSGEVAKYLEEVSKAVGGTVKVKRFVRFETGEGLEKKQEDFAAEVAAQMNA